jgi:two-component system chemotaxis response regulator CheY
MPQTKILVVDDSETLRLQLRTTLVNAGFEVIDASDGLSALDVWSREAESISLIISDYNMPVMDGISMITKIRGLPHGAEIPVIVLTSDSSPALVAAGRAVGVKGWVTKPFIDAKLIAGIKKIMGLP